MLDLVLNNFTTDKTYSQDFFEKILKIASQEAGASSGASISINIAGAGRVKALNKKYRGKNRATDVLSFPMQEGIDIKSKNNAIMDLGDIFICLSVAKKDAKEEKVSVETKLAQLTVHGFLHLLGYDHEDISDKGSMLKLQDSIIEKWQARCP